MIHPFAFAKVAYEGNGFEIHENDGERHYSNLKQLVILWTREISTAAHCLFPDSLKVSPMISSMQENTRAAYMDILKAVGVATVKEQEDIGVRKHVRLVESLTWLLFAAKSLRVQWRFKVRTLNDRKPFEGTAEVTGIIFGSVLYDGDQVSFTIETLLFGTIEVVIYCCTNEIELNGTTTALSVSMDAMPAVESLALLATRRIAKTIAEREPRDGTVKILLKRVLGEAMLPDPLDSENPKYCF